MGKKYLLFKVNYESFIKNTKYKVTQEDIKFFYIGNKKIEKSLIHDVYIVGEIITN